VAGELVERPDTPGDGETQVAQVDVGELQFADGLRSGGVHGGEYMCQANDGCGRDLHRAVDLLRLQGNDDAVVVAADPDPGGWVGEDRAGFLAMLKQRPQNAERVATLAALQRVGDRKDVVASDLSQGVRGESTSQRAPAGPR
jgi:hypothetical protein